MDYLQVTLWVNGIALVLVLGTTMVLAWENSGSRNLALASGTLAAAIILFVIQLTFELQPSTSYDHISVELTIDRSKPSIRQWVYGTGGHWRIGVETEASNWLAANDPTAFSQDRERLALDLVLYSLVSFLTHNEYDWQLKRTLYRGPATGTVTTFEPVSKEHECSKYDTAQIQQYLSEAGNLFAGHPVSILSGRLCLPPRTSVEVLSKSLVLRNPICQVRFNTEPSGGMSFIQPGTGGQVPQLKTGGARYETHQIGLRVQTTNFALRAHHHNSGKYREWCNRIVNGGRDWFET